MYEPVHFAYNRLSASEAFGRIRDFLTTALKDGNIKFASNARSQWHTFL